ncbi:hypothetical protein [Streptomyces javensis]|uniref:Uncharacterized protein n=1 Tax=Streptomyces javensis TaxID=114698 RepID=A0ABN1X1E6_9ACTN
MYTLAVCAEMVFRDLPIQERARRIHDAGFQVEIWDWSRHDPTALERTGAVFSSMTGYLRGSLTDEGGPVVPARTPGNKLPASRFRGVWACRFLLLGHLVGLIG